MPSARPETLRPRCVKEGPAIKPALARLRHHLDHWSQRSLAMRALFGVHSRLCRPVDAVIMRWPCP